MSSVSFTVAQSHGCSRMSVSLTGSKWCESGEIVSAVSPLYVDGTDRSENCRFNGDRSVELRLEFSMVSSSLLVFMCVAWYCSVTQSLSSGSVSSSIVDSSSTRLVQSLSDVDVASLVSSDDVSLSQSVSIFCKSHVQTVICSSVAIFLSSVALLSSNKHRELPIAFICCPI